MGLWTHSQGAKPEVVKKWGHLAIVLNVESMQKVRFGP